MYYAALGLELPCRRAVPATARIELLFSSAPILTAARRSGRLIAPRPLRKALRALLLRCEEEARHALLRLPPGAHKDAEDLVKAYRKWEERVRRQCFTHHHLRLPATERFAAWQLPACAWRQLVAQVHSPLEALAPEHRLTVQALIPVTPCMRLDSGGPDRITAYLHAPSRYLSGPWASIPDHRVRAGYQGNCVLVVVE